ncbi:MAG: ATP-grasp domain-containing protein [Acidobacteriia bacterium]|nr:ATP-grasp domain-containing protein [Terriglobia bacterium]
MDKAIVLVESGPRLLREPLVRMLNERAAERLYFLRNAAEGSANRWIEEYVPHERILEIDFSERDGFGDRVVNAFERCGVRIGSVLASREDYVFHANEVARCSKSPPISCASSLALRHKGLMRQAFNCSGDLAVVRSETVDSVEEGLDKLDTFEGDIVVKPAELLGSVGVWKVCKGDRHAAERRLAEAAAADVVENLRSTTGISSQVVLEEYIPCLEEISVEGYVYQQRARPLLITEKRTSPEPTFFEVGHLIPSKLIWTGRDLVFGTFRRMCHSLSLSDTVVHAEMRVRPDGLVVPVELGARLAGDLIPQLVAAASGIDMERIAVALALGEDPLVETADARGAAGIQFLNRELPPRSWNPDGMPTGVTICRYDSVDEDLSRTGHLFVVGDTREQVLSRLHAVANQLGIGSAFV